MVWAAALANGGSLDDPMPGLEFFKQLGRVGQSGRRDFQRRHRRQGRNADHHALGLQRARQPRLQRQTRSTFRCVYPKSGTIAGVYIQAISAYSPRPNAARLWKEYLYSDEGQLLWLKGYATPARFDDLKARGVIPEDLLRGAAGQQTCRSPSRRSTRSPARPRSSPPSGTKWSA